MNSLQLQCWLGGVIPILNPEQELYIGVIGTISSESLFDVIPNQLNEVKTILLVQQEITSPLYGTFKVAVDFLDGSKVSSACSNPTSVFLIN
jgi:hypothetical protein